MTLARATLTLHALVVDLQQMERSRDVALSQRSQVRHATCHCSVRYRCGDQDSGRSLDASGFGIGSAPTASHTSKITGTLQAGKTILPAVLFVADRNEDEDYVCTADVELTVSGPRRPAISDVNQPV